MGINKIIKLHLGCGNKHKKGWTNIDINPKSKADIITDVSVLKMFKNNSVDVIESYHLFEHLFPNQAKGALREWYRVLKPTGQLYIEMPNLKRCAEILLNSKNKADIELALMGIYGFEKASIFPDGEGKKPFYPQVHKFGWTPDSLQEALSLAGFKNIKSIEPTQKWRKAYRVKRDMRVYAEK
jgi:ubiquinone/menaquinone biosynthesis C-methylase UbiE